MFAYDQFISNNEWIMRRALHSLYILTKQCNLEMRKKRSRWY